uniref:Large ribosomal subunit protein uL14c n=1 Tax=Gastrodia bawanglingensis TaxID=2980163 RepID=A0A977LJC3_9ASPA|nr:ribosomal protein L14 [Gastrodia bawanglingensis]
MIQPKTLLKVADNSGAQEVMCIRILGAKYNFIGNVIIAVIKKTKPRMLLERSEVIRAVIVCACKEFKRNNGIIIRYDGNAAVLIDKDGNPKGTRIFGVIPQELRNFNFTKIISLSPNVL